ncbi:MAG: ROK family protein [Cytophagales bacterium]|nr:ROK family protein [Bernardetiaceae bacterium]MDW8210665.1 ROK family protein [Cytophagales bacterium]
MQTGMPEYVLGVDIGGTYTKYGFVNREGNCIGESYILTHADEPFTHFLVRLVQAIEESRRALGFEIALRGIGIGAPNANYYTGRIEKPANLSWGDVDVVGQLSRHYRGIPIVITNDANAAAIGEMKFGAARNMRDFIMITLGTGLGSGIVANGKLVYGHDGFAGEMGHVIVDPNGRMHSNGRRGALETYVSASGIKRTVFYLMAEYPYESELRHLSYHEMTSEHITAAALRGDKIALEAYEYTGRILGMKLADAVAHTSPEAIIFFGGLTKAGNLLLEPVKRHMEAYLFPIYRNKVKLLISALEGKNVAVLGASALAWNEIDSNMMVSF